MFQGLIGAPEGSAEPEVPKVAKATEPVPAEADRESASDVEGQAAESPDSDETVEAEGADEPADPDVATDEPAGDTPVETFEQLAKGLGQDEAALLKAIKVPGLFGKQVSLADVVEAYKQSGQSGTLRTQLEARRTEVDQKLATYEAERDQSMGQLQALTEKLLDMVDTDRKVDWEKLKAEDPLKYALDREAARERHDAARHAITLQQREAQRLEQETAQGRKKWQSDEAAKLMTARPDWKDKAALTGALEDVQQVMTSHGLEYQEVEDYLHDHRILQIAWKARQWDKLQEKSPLTMDALKKAPKRVVVTPVGGDRKAPPARDSKMTNAREQLRRTGSVADGANYFMNVLNQEK